MAAKFQEQIHVPDHRLQTKNLAVETWHQIFRYSSHIHSTDEFSPKARLHNRLVWDPNYDENDAKVDPDGLAEALKARATIVLVCKAWYAMGIEILYSHMNITETLCDEMAFYRLLNDTGRLLQYTRRLSLSPCLPENSLPIEPMEHLRRAAWLCASLPHLQILYAPQDFMTFFPLECLPKALEVVVSASGTFEMYKKKLPPCPLPAVWTGIRVLNVITSQLVSCTPAYPQAVVFASLEELLVREHFMETDEEYVRIAAYIGSNWRAPKLKGLLLFHSNGYNWKKFLLRHAQSLEMLCICTWGQILSWEDDHDKQVVSLSNLKVLYIDYWEQVPSFFIADGLERVGIHDLGVCEDDPEPFEEGSNAMQRSREAFISWQSYPKLKACSFTGWEGFIYWLEEQPVGVDFSARMEKRGVKVDFIGLGDQVLGYGDENH